ncbi:hypothetical protein [Paracraurococcus ruber]|uniref:hypothetical protein n=1 Tax=Paracraurococcus ruber TaxID=77675 RepID=UPI0013053F76|nr:hypothetical protein [Paracraurococcus ruber]
MNFPGANQLLQETGPSIVTIGGQGTSGRFQFDFDGPPTADRFLDVALVLNSWGADLF